MCEFHRCFINGALPKTEKAASILIGPRRLVFFSFIWIYWILLEIAVAKASSTSFSISASVVAVELKT